MRGSVLVACALVVLAVSARPAQAQEELIAQCVTVSPRWEPHAPPGQTAQAIESQFRFLCGQVVNAITALHPSVGVAFSGGNPVLGTGTTLGRRWGTFPRLSATGRLNMALIEAPDVFRFAANYSGDELPPMERMLVPMLALQGDVVLGVFDGITIPPRISGLGAIDLLGSVSFVPAVSRVGIDETIHNLGGGVRVGILRQGLLTPGLSVSGMYRRTGTTSFGPDELMVGDAARFSTDLTTISLRAVASKGLPMMNLALGGGYDRYTSDLDFAWRLQCGTVECHAAGAGQPMVVTGEIPTSTLTTSAWNVFGNATLSLLVLHLVAELGYQWPTNALDPSDLQALNPGNQRFTDRELSSGRVFGSLGLRVSF